MKVENPTISVHFIMITFNPSKISKALIAAYESWKLTTMKLSDDVYK